MFSLFPVLGFAQIHAEAVHDGIMPNKRQAVGTGVTTSTSESATTSSETSQTSDTTSATSTPSSTDSPTSTTPSSTAATTTTPTSNDQTTTSDAGTTTPSSTEASTTSAAAAAGNTSSADSSSDAPSSSNAPSSTDASSTEASSTPAETVSSSVRTSVPVTTTNSAGSTVTSQVATDTFVAVSTKSSAAAGPVRTESGKSSNLVVIGSSTINRSTLSQATTITSALLAEETQDYTTTTFWTSDGTTGSSVITGRRTLTSTTGYATATIDPSLANGGDGGSGSSLTPHTKAIIGGVVGGIGGAILLGGIAIVAWRLWGKKKREQLPQDDYMESPADSIRREKGTSGAPFRPDTAASYQNPNGAVNTASNF